MPISQTHSTRLQEVEVLPSKEALPLNSGGIQKIVPNSGLHQTFKNDVVSSKNTTSQKIVLEEKSPSFWDRFSSWISFDDVKPAEAPPVAPQADTIKKAEPISPIPVLEAPDEMPPELQTATLPPFVTKKNSRQTLSPAEVMEAVSLMHEHTLDEVMAIVLQGQLELEKEHAIVAENTLTKYEDIKKMRQKVLEEIKDALLRDEKVLSYCKTAQNVALVASVICGIAAGVVSYGALAPAGAAVGSVLGAGVAAAFTAVVSFIATVGPVATAGLTAVTTGSKAYSKRRLDEDTAQHFQFQHQETMGDKRIEDARERLTAIAETDQVYKERLVQLLKRSAKMRQLVRQK